MTYAVIALGLASIVNSYAIIRLTRTRRRQRVVHISVNPNGRDPELLAQQVMAALETKHWGTTR